MPKLAQPEVKVISIDKIKLNDYNPNEMSAAVFNELVKNIKTDGFYDPIQVAPEKDGTFTVIDGEHRFRALQVIGFDQVSCVISGIEDKDLRKFTTMKNRFIQGKIDKVKFTKLWTELVKKYGADRVQELFYVSEEDKKTLDALILQVKSGLPEDMKHELDKKKAAGEIKNVEDLSRIVNEMFAKYGSTVDRSYMVFTFGGKSHLWVEMNKELKKKIDFITEKSAAEGRNINDVFMEALR